MQLKTLLSSLEEPPLAFLNSNRVIEYIEIVSLAYDSRQVLPGGLFIAAPGTHTDGRRFLADAARNGAVAALGPQIDTTSPPLPYIEGRDERIALANIACAFYGYPGHQLCTIGVTGTDGKTTTSNLISTIFDSAGKSTGMMTTANFKLRGQ